MLTVHNKTGDREIGPLGSDNDGARSFPVSTYCVYLSRALWPIIEPKATVCYHAVIGNYSPLNRMAKKPGGEYMASLNGEMSNVNEDVEGLQPLESQLYGVAILEKLQHTGCPLLSATVPCKVT